MKVLVVGPSGSGKTTLLGNLAGEFSVCDMDRKIDTNLIYEEEALNSVLRRLDFELIAVSVFVDFLKYLEALKRTGRQHWDLVVYLRPTSRRNHLERLNAVDVYGDFRSNQDKIGVVSTLGVVDQICLELADRVIDIDACAPDHIAALVREDMSKLKVRYLTRDRYLRLVESMPGDHWSSAGSRWPYHELAASWVASLKPSSPHRVLEMGTMGVTIVEGSDTLDYDASNNNPDWNIAGFKPVICHDLRVLPWPIKNSKYDVAVALRVFHHLVPVQRECFLEMRRIAKSTILVVPSAEVHPRGISKGELVLWAGREPDAETQFPGDLGGAYLWA